MKGQLIPQLVTFFIFLLLLLFVSTIAAVFLSYLKPKVRIIVKPLFLPSFSSSFYSSFLSLHDSTQIMEKCDQKAFEETISNVKIREIKIHLPSCILGNEKVKTKPFLSSWIKNNKALSAKIYVA